MPLSSALSSALASAMAAVPVLQIRSLQRAREPQIHETQPEDDDVDARQKEQNGGEWSLLVGRCRGIS